MSEDTTPLGRWLEDDTHGRRSASWLAKRAGLSVSHVTRILRREREASPDTAVALSRVTGGDVSVAEILWPDGSPEDVRIY